MNERVILIIPPSPWLISDTDLPMLGILYIATYLKNHNIDVTVCDLSGLKEDQWKIPIGEYYGITGTSPQFIYMKRIIEILKERQPDCTVIVGGAHASCYPEHIEQNTRADIIVRGRGEYFMRTFFDTYFEYTKIVNMIDTKSCRDSSNIFPDYDQIDFYKYSKSQTFKYLLGDVREATVMTARGCPYNCSFCAQACIWGGRVVYRDVDNVIEEIEWLKSKYGVKLIYFIDDTFIIDKNRVIEICAHMRRLGMKWHCLSRVDSVDRDILNIMRYSGCLQVVYGFESGSNYILEKASKKTTIEQAYEAIKLTKEAGMRIRGQMIVGLPFETDKTVEETAEFIRRAQEVDAIGLHMFYPFPGCDVWNNPEKYNYYIDKNTDFSEYHTIGRPCDPLTKNAQKQGWYDYLKSVIGERSIEAK